MAEGNATGVCQALRSGEKENRRIACDPAEIKLIRDEINALDLPKYWQLEARTVEKG
jgi:hypothetical protein